MKSRVFSFFLLGGFLALLSGCATSSRQGTPSGPTGVGGGITATELNTNPPPFWDGQRVYVRDRMTWGYIKRPEQDWTSARLVLLNEDKFLAPHRSLAGINADHNCRYKLQGSFWERKAYDPVINRLLDVFVLTGWESLGQGDTLPLKDPGTALVRGAGSPGRSSERGTRSSNTSRSSGTTYENIE